MATISITIPDALVPRVRAALDAHYRRNLDETDGQFFKRVLGQHVRSIVSGYEANLASATARTTAESEITVT